MTAPPRGPSSAFAAPLLSTERTRVDLFTLDDAPFALELLNEPLFLRFIGDKRARTLDAARAYLQEGALTSYETHGWGLYRVALKHTSQPIGLCGFVKRDELPCPDFGYAFLERFHGQGFAGEAARAILRYGVEQLRLRQLLAITDAANQPSKRLLTLLGFQFVEDRVLFGETKLTRLYEFTVH